MLTGSCKQTACRTAALWMTQRPPLDVLGSPCCRCLFTRGRPASRAAEAVLWRSLGQQARIGCRPFEWAQTITQLLFPRLARSLSRISPLPALLLVGLPRNRPARQQGSKEIRDGAQAMLTLIAVEVHSTSNPKGACQVGQRPCTELACRSCLASAHFLATHAKEFLQRASLVSMLPRLEGLVLCVPCAQIQTDFVHWQAHSPAPVTFGYRCGSTRSSTGQWCW